MRLLLVEANICSKIICFNFTVAKDAQGMDACADSAKEGGTIAQHTRKELEQKIGKPLISEENYLHLAEKKKKLIEDKK